MYSIGEKTKQMLGVIPGDLPNDERVLFEGDSSFNHLIVTERKGRLLLAFGNLGHEHETAYNPAAPDEPLFEYPGLMCAALALTPNAGELLLVGLGGGYIPGLLRRHRPDLRLTVVEIDPLVAQVAHNFFNFRADERLRLVIADGREFLAGHADLYNHIWLDAYNGAYIPGPLMTTEFLALCRERLQPGGALVQNVHFSNPLYDAHLATMYSVFGPFYLGLGRRKSNAMLVAQKTAGPWPPPATAFAAGLKKYGRKLGPINLKAEISKFTLIDTPPKGRLLEDRDYQSQAVEGLTVGGCDFKGPFVGKQKV